MKGVNPAEVLSESDSDNENTAAVEIPILDSYLAAFEADDETIRLTGKGNAKAEAIYALSEEIEKNKQKDIAWLPSQITAANKQITENEYKFSIL